MLSGSPLLCCFFLSSSGFCGTLIELHFLTVTEQVHPMIAVCRIFRLSLFLSYQYSGVNYQLHVMKSFFFQDTYMCMYTQTIFQFVA